MISLSIATVVNQNQSYFLQVAPTCHLQQQKIRTSPLPPQFDHTGASLT